MKQPKNIIIGMAYGYTNENIAPFLNSLKAINYGGELLLFVNRKSNINPEGYDFKITSVNPIQGSFWIYQLHRFLKTLVQLLFIRGFWDNLHLQRAEKHMQNHQPFPRWLFFYFLANYYLATSRYCIYYNFLIKNKYDNIFFSDVTDVVFQKDIFSFVNDHTLRIFEENSQVAIVDQINNRDWIEWFYGKEVLNEIGRNPIFCSGTILGSYTCSIQFLKDFIQQLINGRNRKASTKKLVGLDQGIYNYMIHKENLDYFEKIANGKIVFTMGIHCTSDAQVNNENIVYAKRSSECPAVIHQYNRGQHLNIHKYVEKKYRHMPVKTS